MRTLIVAVVIVGLIIASGVAWTAGELHYTGCVAAAQAANPNPVERRLVADIRTELREQAQRRRVAAVNDCSRVP